MKFFTYVTLPREQGPRGSRGLTAGASYLDPVVKPRGDKGLITGAISLILLFSSSCIMTKDKQYQSVSSYLDTRYNIIMNLEMQKQLSMGDVDEAYLLSAVYLEKNRLKEAKNLLKIVFDSQKTLPSGLAYINVLKKMGETQEADKVYKFLSVLYDENEIQDQKRNFGGF